MISIVKSADSSLFLNKINFLQIIYNLNEIYRYTHICV